MSQFYNNYEVNNISNYAYRVYIEGVEIGPIPAEDLSFNNAPNKELIGSSTTGEAPIASLNKGTAESTLSFPVQAFNKHQIKTAFLGMVSEGSTATNVSTPFIGSLNFQSQPQRDKTLKVVAVLYFTDLNGDAKAPDATATSLPMNILMPKAVLVEGGEFIFNPTAVGGYELTFQGLADTSNSARTAIMDDGIDTDGTYTP